MSKNEYSGREMICIMSKKILHELLNLPEEYIVLDIETTGFKPESARIIEIAAVKYSSDGEKDTFATLINPGTKIPRKIIELTGISQMEVDTAPTWEDIQADFVSFIGNSLLVGHNIKEFDIGFINYALGYVLPNQILDTLELARLFFPAFPNHRLSYLRETLEIDVTVSHRALADVHTTHRVLMACVANQNAIPATFNNAESKPKNNSRYHKKVKIQEIVPSESATQNSVLRGKIVVFTGTLSIEREKAMQLAVDAGAVIRTAVSKKTDYLVVGQQDVTIVGFNGMSHKEETAHAINQSGKAHVEIIDEQTFLNLCHTNSDEKPSEDSPKKNPPSQEEIEAFELLKSNCDALFASMNFPAELLLIKGITEKSGIYIIDESHLLSYLRIRKNKKYLSFPEGIEELIPESMQRYTLTSTPGVVYVALQSALDVMSCSEAFCETIRRQLLSYHTFDCCGRYMQCSDAMRCIHPNPIDALGCTYKKHLQQGRIFYGKNRNID